MDIKRSWLPETDGGQMVALIGPIPPPFGGVSVFMTRFSDLLHTYGSHVEMMEVDGSLLSRIRHALRILVGRPARFYLNVPDYLLMAALLIRGRAPHSIYVDHGERLARSSVTGVRGRIFSKFLQACRQVVFVGGASRELYESVGLPLPADTVVRSAYIPPPLGRAEIMYDLLPADLKHFLSTHSPIIVANAYKVLFHNGVDLYGLDLCVDLHIRLKQRYPNAGFVFAIADRDGSEEQLRAQQDKLAREGALDSFYVLTSQAELWPIFTRADAMVRPTSADGYGFSVDEAIDCGCVAVASDVCARHPAAILFRSRDANALFGAVIKALRQGRAAHRHEIAGVS